MCMRIMTYLIPSGGWLFCSHLSTLLVIIVVFALKHIKIFIHSDDWIVIREEVVLDGSPPSTPDGSLASTPDGSLASTPHGSPRSTPRTPRVPCRAGLPRTSRTPRTPRTQGQCGGNVRVLGTPGRARAVHVQHHESGKEGITKAIQSGRYEKAIGLLEITTPEKNALQSVVEKCAKAEVEKASVTHLKDTISPKTLEGLLLKDVHRECHEEMPIISSIMAGSLNGNRKRYVLCLEVHYWID